MFKGPCTYVWPARHTLSEVIPDCEDIPHACLGCLHLCLIIVARAFRVDHAMQQFVFLVPKLVIHVSTQYEALLLSIRMGWENQRIKALNVKCLKKHILA